MSPKARSKPGRPKDLVKREAILNVAGKLFLTRGYEGTSVDAIAEAAGVSKLTIYSHFADKAGLFKNLVKNKCESYLEHDSYERVKQLRVEKALTVVARNFVGLSLNDEVLALQRVIVADAVRNPELAAMYYEAGPGNTIAEVAAVLEGFHATGELLVEDATQAADHFVSMLRGDQQIRALLRVGRKPGEAKIRRHVHSCVALFIRAYGRRAPDD